jgi:hypothetical protein
MQVYLSNTALQRAFKSSQWKTGIYGRVGRPSLETGFSHGPKGRNYFPPRSAALKIRSSTTH